MKQSEMSGYLKIVTLGVGVFLLAFVLWFLPLIVRDTLVEAAGTAGYRGTCLLVGISAVPALLCLVRFWGICESIGQDRSFSPENALRLKRMSQYMLTDAALYAGFLVWFFAAGWYQKAAWLLFAVLLAVFICVAMTVVCAALSHLVQKAGALEEEQELTI